MSNFEIKKELNQDELVTYVDAAIIFYQQVSGKLPLTFHIQRLLAVVGISEPLGRLNPITQELLQKHNHITEDNSQT